MKSVEQNNSIQGLNLDENVNGKTIEVVKGLSDLLNDSKGLETLSISENSLGKDLASMFKALSNNNNLTKLDISGNVMGDTAATSLAEALGKNTCLRKLEWDATK